MTDDDRVAGLERQVAELRAELDRMRQAGASPPAPDDAAVQPTDLASYLDPDQRDRVRSALGRLSALDAGFGHDWQHQLSGLLGGAVPPTATAAGVARVEDPPRSVPLSLRLTVLTWSWYEAFLLFIGTTAPIALWGLVPASVPAGLLAALLVIVAVRVRRHGRRQRLLRWGKVVDVTSAEVVSTGSYYSGITYNNMIVPQAHGWQVDRRFYSGPATTTAISYTLDGRPGRMTLRGLPYAGGVVLADSRRPDVALCVSQFPYDVAPGTDGRLLGHLKVRTWFGILAELVVLVVLAAGAVVAVDRIWLA